MKNKEVKKFILEMNTAMKAISTSLVGIEKEVATMKTQIRLLTKTSAEILPSAN